VQFYVLNNIGNVTKIVKNYTAGERVFPFCILKKISACYLSAVDFFVLCVHQPAGWKCAHWRADPPTGVTGVNFLSAQHKRDQEKMNIIIYISLFLSTIIIIMVMTAHFGKKFKSWKI
jgi:hypothetical protein